MKSAQLTKYGGQDAIVINNEVAKPEPGEGQVLVEVYSAALNPFDYKIREGYLQEYIPMELPATLGSDVAGKVAALGGGVTGFEIGQDVYGMANSVGGSGSYAEFTPVKATQLVGKPASASYDTAAALPLAGISAYQAIVDHIGLKPDQKILIHGGAGGIGAIAIQIAKNIGAHVATTVSAKDVDYVKELGADEVIDYASQDFTKLISDYDAVFDNVGGETNESSYQVLKSGGTLVSMNDGPNEELVTKYGINYIQQSSTPTVERLTKLAELVDANKVKVNIDKVFTLDETPEALEYLKTGHPRGKVVLSVKQ